MSEDKLRVNRVIHGDCFLPFSGINGKKDVCLCVNGKVL